ncbi:MAG TPA: XrtA system polysaccharide chain length determinant [Rhodanobacter sp.]|nr:XrtA system polysaccharide chain length determinant [Rhodanobacter sp.]
MNEETNPLLAMLPLLLTEAKRRRLALVVIFASIALLALIVGVNWPRRYDASVTILAQKSSIITPLMEGAASTTGNANRAGIAKAVIFSRKVMNQILAAGGWMANHPSPVEQDRLIEQIKSRTVVQIAHDNLITINYHDSDAKRAYAVTHEFGQLFISESLASKKRESRDAFEFINSQVEAYRKKLTDAEDKLKDYRNANADARPGSETDTNTSISQLRNQIETARMDLMEKRSQEVSLNAQLSGESEISSVQTSSGIYESQLASLQTELDKLRLTYTDDYPDVVRVRHQIEDLRQQLAHADQRKQAARAIGGNSNVSAIQFNPLYQQMKGQVATLRADIASTSTRLAASQAILESELERSKRIANSEAVTSELTRDYTVNRDVYQDLLKRRENARVSMNLDAEQDGLSFVVQNPAVMPLTPSGLRFMHFAIAGILAGLAAPFGLLFGIARLDPRVRSIEQLESSSGLQVLASVPFYPTPADRRREHRRTVALTLIVLAVVIVYLIVFWLKLKGLA